MTISASNVPSPMLGASQSPDTTIAIVLGASRWPKAPKLSAPPSFAKSAAAFLAYLRSEEGFQLLNENLLNLFDTEDSPSGVVERISEFLIERKAALEERGLTPSGLIFYYVGHGSFGSRDYILALRNTNSDLEAATSLRMADFADAIQTHLPSVRRFLIFDCCFAAAAYAEFQAAPLSVAVQRTVDAFPKHGTALLCASGAKDPAKAPSDEIYTMFSGALLDVLKKGNPHAPAILSLFEVGNLSAELVREKYADKAVRPEVHTPQQTEGNVALIPLFPNAALRVPIETRVRATEARLDSIEQSLREIKAGQTELLRNVGGLEPSSLPGRGFGEQKQALPVFMAVVEKIADEMRAAFGPKGQNIIVRNSDGSVLRTRDGITIAREFKFEDPLENMAAQLLKDAAEGTRKMTGDGAKTTVFLVHSLLSQAVAAIKAGAKPIAIRAGIQAAVTAICGSVDSTAGRTPGTLDRQAKQLRGSEVVTNVGTISANNEKKIGILVSEAMKKVGRDGVIIVMESKTLETTLQVVEGLQFDRGYISPHFITDSKEKQCVLDAAHILIHEKPISSMKDLLPLLEQIAKLGRPLLIIAEDVNGEALATLIVNKLRETLQCAAVRAPGFGDRRKAMLEDLAILTGAKAITEEIGIKLENVKIEDLGRAKKIFIDENSCTIVEGYGKNSEIEGRILRLRREIEMTTGDYDRQKLQERLDKLVSGVAIINVAAGSEFEKERRESLVREAICAVRCASEEGVVAGGGGALPRAARDLGALHDGEEQRKGVDIVRSACDVVLLQLAANNLKNGELLIDEVLKNPTAEYGFSATHDKCMNLMEVGIIEPVAVPRVALRNAASVAIEILSSRKFSAAI